MLEEAVELIRDLWRGDEVTKHGEHFTTDRARIHSVPDSVPPGPLPPVDPAPSVWISSLASARPNPWTPSTRIAFTTGGAGAHVRIDLFDVTGRLVRTLVDGPQPTGPGEVTWDGRYADGRVAPQGLYFYQMMAADGFRAVERLGVIR